MAWIESHQELARHPKVRRLARTLGISVPTAIGHLHLLWWWALDFAEDGDLSRFTSADLADVALWEGDPDDFVDALVDCGGEDHPGFLERANGRLILHDWDEYAGRLIERRQKDRDRKRMQYAARMASAGVPSEIHRNSTGDRPELRRNSGATVPYRTGPDRSTTDVVAAAGAAAPAVPDPELSVGKPGEDGLCERLLTRLRETKNRTGVLLEAHGVLFGDRFAPSPARLGALAKRYGAGQVLATMFRIAPSWKGIDDPLDYLTGALRSSRSPPEPRDPGYRDFQEMLAEQEVHTR